jgi:hypothetical protein
MFKQTLALVGLTLSLSANAEIVIHGNLFTDDTTDYITDTLTGRQYKRLHAFDITYAETIESVSSGGIYEGWTIADAIIPDEFAAAALGTPNTACDGNAPDGTVCGVNTSWTDADFGAAYSTGFNY